MTAHKISSNLKPSDYQAIAELRYQIRRFLRFSEEAARAVGLSPQQHQLMLATKGMPGGRPARISDLAERLQIQHHSAVELVDRLAARGLVTRALGEVDRREVYVQLTSSGESILSVLTLHHKNELRQAAPALVATLQSVGGMRQPDGARKSAHTRISRRRTSHVASVNGRAGA
ncbi:MAG: MarR family transcriptional regulator [Candidatus Korobacteraceae bacterium]